MFLSPSDLKGVFREYGFSLSDQQAEKFSLYLQEILRWNRVHNLVGDDDPETLVRRHFVDSLTLTLCFKELNVDWRNRTVADVGSGAGFPGVPLKIYLGDVRLTLIESVAKKCSFLEFLKVKLGEDYEVLCDRAERVRRTFHIVVARALGDLEDITPLLERLSERYIFVMKGRRIDEALVRKLGYRVYRVNLTGIDSSILYREVIPPSR